VIRFFPYFRDPQRKHGGLLAMLLLFGLVVGLIAMLVLGVFHDHFSRWFSDRNALYARHGLLILPLVFSEVYFLLLRSYSRSVKRTVQPIFLREFLLRLLQTGLILVQAWKPMPFGTFMILYIAIFLVCTLGLVLDLWRAGEFRPGLAEWRLPGRLRRSMVSYSSFTFSATLAGVVLGNIDQMMIGALLGDGLRKVALYAVAFYFGSVIAAPGRALYQAALPLLADAWKRRDLKEISSLYTLSSLVQTLLGGFLFLLMWMSLDDLFQLLPLEYAGAAPVAWVIGLAYVLNTSVGLNLGILSMSRSYRLDAWSSVVMLVINIVANFLLIRAFGIIGAAWATLISLVVLNAFRVWFLHHRYKLWPFSLRHVLIVLLIVALAFVIPWIPLSGDALVDILLRSMLVAVVFWPAAYVMGVVPDVRALLKRKRKPV
jgi:O-antigen/teichoic acid export membrane protein